MSPSIIRSIRQMLHRIIEPPVSLPRERQYFSNRALMNLTAPILVESLLALLVGIADTIMVSYAGEAAVSGVSLVNQLNNVFIYLFGALASGGAVVASQYVGRKDRENGIAAASQLMMLTAFISLLLMGLCILLHRQLLHLLFSRVAPDVMAASATYLVLSAWSFPAAALYSSSAALFRSMGKTQAVMNTSIVMNVINVVGNYIGIFVLHAGVAGVAVPSLISRMVAALIMVMLLMNPKHLLCTRVRETFCWNGEMIRRILKLAVPKSIENGLFQLSKVSVSSILALFGTAQIAAYGVAQSFWSLSALFCIAMGSAFLTVVGQSMGAGDIPAARYYMQKLWRMTYLGSVLWNLVTLFLIQPILPLFSLSAETRHMVVILVLMHNVGNAVLCATAFALSDGLRAAGDARYTMYATLFGTVVCRVFFSVVFGIWLNLGVYGITLAMVGDWLVKALLILFRYRSGRWTAFRVI